MDNDTFIEIYNSIRSDLRHEVMKRLTDASGKGVELEFDVLEDALKIHMFEQLSTHEFEDGDPVESMVGWNKSYGKQAGDLGKTLLLENIDVWADRFSDNIIYLAQSPAGKLDERLPKYLTPNYTDLDTDGQSRAFKTAVDHILREGVAANIPEDSIAESIVEENAQGIQLFNWISGYKTIGELKQKLNLDPHDTITPSIIAEVDDNNQLKGYQMKIQVTRYDDADRADVDDTFTLYEFLKYLPPKDGEPGVFVVEGSTEPNYDAAAIKTNATVLKYYEYDGETIKPYPVVARLEGGQLTDTYEVVIDGNVKVLSRDDIKINNETYAAASTPEAVAAPDPNMIELKQDQDGNYYSYVYDPAGNLVKGPNLLLDDNGDPFVSFAQAQQAALEEHRSDQLAQEQKQFELQHELNREKYDLDKVLGFQAQALDEAQFNANQLQFNANMAENARQFDEANRLRAFAQQEQARATNIQAGFQINQARSEALDQVRDVLRNPADYLARGFALAGQESPFTPVTQADLINQVTSEYDAYKDFLGSLGAGFNAEEFLAGGQKTGGPLNVVNPDDFYDDGGNGGSSGGQNFGRDANRMKRAEMISKGIRPPGGVTTQDIEWFPNSGYTPPGIPGKSQSISTQPIAELFGTDPYILTDPTRYEQSGVSNFAPGGFFDISDSRTSGTAGEITKDNPLSQSELDALANLSEANIQTGFGGGLTAEQIAAFRKTGQVPAAEHGGMFGNPVIVGDSSRGKENQELVMSANGAPMVVLPLTDQQVKILEGKRNNNMPKAQTGGMFGFDDFVGFGNRVGNIGFGGTMYNQLPNRTITQRDIIERAERFGTPRVSNVAQGRMPMPMQFGFPLMTPGQLNTLTGDEREELRTRLASRNVSLGDVETAVMQRFGPTGVRRGRRRF
jgi:hypothetical protein